MLYSFTKKDKLRPLPKARQITIEESDSPELMSALGQITIDEAAGRLENENKAFVAYWSGIPAAFGWMAMGKARIGELNHELILPLWHRYLWNFRTLPEFRGKGIYPNLLQHILSSEIDHTDCFWIMHAPENQASEKGIYKVGFQFVSKVSVVDNTEVIVYPDTPSKELSLLIESSGFIRSEKEQATCWNCSSPYMKNRKPTCCCTEREVECNYRAVGNSLALA